MTLLRQAALVAGKDLRIEARSRVLVNQVLPFGGLVLVLFAFALDPDRGILRRAAPGLFWIAVLLATLLAIGRAFAVEEAEGARDGLRLSGLDGGAIFLGKVASVATQLFALEVLLGMGVVLLYGVEIRNVVLILVSSVLATLGLATAGAVYGVLAAGLRVRETLLPLLLLPVLAPVMLSATQAWVYALDGDTAESWPWIGILAVFASIYAAVGFVAFEPLLEES